MSEAIEACNSHRKQQIQVKQQTPVLTDGMIDWWSDYTALTSQLKTKGMPCKACRGYQTEAAPEQREQEHSPSIPEEFDDGLVFHMEV
jgi:hypothetical protein